MSQRGFEPLTFGLRGQQLNHFTTQVKSSIFSQNSEFLHFLEKLLTKIPYFSASLTDTLALDCEYVGVGYNGNNDHLARVSIVNAEGKTIYDKYVLPREEVVDYRTHVSGVQPGHLSNGTPFNQVQQEVHKLISNKTVVGHGLCNDFRVMNLTHPQRLTRDSATWKPLRKMVGISTKPSLKLLSQKLLNINIQEGEHDSVIDAKAALR